MFTSNVRAEVVGRNPQVPESSEGPPPSPYYRRLPESALADHRLTRCALALLAKLDGYAREKAECWPSVATLMAELGYCRRSIQLALRTLKQCGYLDERPAPNPTGRALVLLWKRGAQTADTPGAQAPYSQGLPRERNRRAPDRKAGQGREGKGFGSAGRIPEAPPRVGRRAPEPPPTLQERAEALRAFRDAMPPGTPVVRGLEARLRALGVPIRP